MKRAPNFLFVMADQMAAPALPIYGHPVVKTPHLQALADKGTVFENAYCAYPICAPSRYSMLSGQLPSRIGAFDNAAEFSSTVPTFLHYLRSLNYKTCLSGKMHFVGADQLHGFEERLTTDIYPADFGWTPDWRKQDLSYTWSHHMQSVVEAGVCHRSLQIDFDEEVANQAVQKIYDLGRDPEVAERGRPFFFLVSFTHPHDPFTCLPEHWGRYDDSEIDMPVAAPIAPEKMDPHSRRLHYLNSTHRYNVTPEIVRRARHAYYGMISYVDDFLGRLMTALDRAGLAEDTVVIFTGDHGEMMGERGMWYKMTFFEWSSRVPLVMHIPGAAARRERRNVSLLDLFPTILDLASGSAPNGGSGPLPTLVDGIDGHSLAPLLRGGGDDRPDEVVSEYLGEGAFAPVLMLKRGTWKYVHCDTDPPQLYDLAKDPQELDNLCGRPEAAEMEREMAAAVRERWDTADLKRRVIESQTRRLFIHDVLIAGEHFSWDYQPRVNAAKQYVRNVGITEDEVKAKSRLPYVQSIPPDIPG